MPTSSSIQTSVTRNRRSQPDAQGIAPIRTMLSASGSAGPHDVGDLGENYSVGGPPVHALSSPFPTKLHRR